MIISISSHTFSTFHCPYILYIYCLYGQKLIAVFENDLIQTPDNVGYLDHLVHVWYINDLFYLYTVKPVLRDHLP